MRPASRAPSTSDSDSKRFSMPLCTQPSRSSSRRTFSPTTWKRKWTRLDDARVHGSDGDLVHAIAFHLHERVFLLSGLPLLLRDEVAAQRELVDRQLAIHTHGRWSSASDGMPTRSNAAALHAARGGKDRRKIGILRALGHRVLEQREAVRVAQDDAQAEAARVVALVGEARARRARRLPSMRRGTRRAIGLRSLQRGARAPGIAPSRR
jgi:hypothetical protein